MHYRHYYSELAKLLYAVAYSDGSINTKEKEQLKSIVRQSLVPAEKHLDHFGTDVAYYVEIEFDILLDSLPDAETAFQSYLNFIEKHQTVISKPLMEASLNAAKKISKASRGTNKVEAGFLHRLQKKMEEISATQ